MCLSAGLEHCTIYGLLKGVADVVRGGLVEKLRVHALFVGTTYQYK